MASVRAIVSEAKHGEGLARFTGPVLDVSDKNPNVPEWIRRVRTWLELNAIDGTASGLTVSPFEEPKASFPRETGSNSWIPVDPDTGDPAPLDIKTLEKLKGAKFVSYAAIQVNLANQARVIFQVIMHTAISKQSQAAVKNSVEWATLAEDLNRWADLLNLIVVLHTVHRGSRVGEAAIVAKFAFDHKIRSYKQIGSVDSGTHLERFDDLVAEGKALGVAVDQKELAYLVVNSMKSNAARNKRNLLMDLGQNTPQSYAVAKAFVLEAEAMARSVADFNSSGSVRGYAAVTESNGPDPGSSESGQETQMLEETNLATTGGKGTRRVYTPLQKKNWKELSADAKKKVTELEALADKIRGGENIEVDLRTVTSSLTSTTVPNPASPKKCWKCGGDHLMADCPQKDAIKGAPHAPVRKFYKGKRSGGQKKGDTVAVVQNVEERESSDDDYYYHLDNLVVYRGSASSFGKDRRSFPPELFLDDSDDSDTDLQNEDCLITFDDEDSHVAFYRRLRSLKGLSAASRVPTDEEITFQADLIGFPALSQGVIKKNRWETVEINGVQVVKGGCFDTSKDRKHRITWNHKGMLDSDDPKNMYSTYFAKATAKPTCTDSDEERGSVSLRSSSSSSSKSTDLNPYMFNADIKRELGSDQKVPQTKKGTAYSDNELSVAKREKDRAVAALEDAKREHEETKLNARETHAQYEKALQVVREIAATELEAVRKMAVKEVNKLQSELDRAREELKAKEDVVSKRDADAISGSLSRAMERNTYLVGCLDKADLEREREKEQSQFYQKVVAEQREEIKKIHVELSSQRKEDDERAESYRQSYLKEQRLTESLRKALAETNPKPASPDEDGLSKQLDKLSAELRATEEKLVDSMQRERRTDGLLKEAEQIGGAALEELDNCRRIAFPETLSVRKESPVSVSGGQYESLREEGDSADDEQVSEPAKKRPAQRVRAGRRTSPSTKRAKTARTDESQGPSQKGGAATLVTTPPKAPEFDPSTMESITPIFGNSQAQTETRSDEAAIKAAKREKKLQKELAKLAPGQGIDLHNYTKRMVERHDAEQTAAEERERVKAKIFILWNCPRSVEIRERLRVTEFSHHHVSEREKIYRNILTKPEDGPREYIKFLNYETSDSATPPLTMEWLEDQVRLWMLHPSDRPKPAKIERRERPDPIMWQRIIDARDKRAEERKRAERASGADSEQESCKNQRGNVPEDSEYYQMPDLVEDSSDDEEGKNKATSNTECKQKVSDNIASETLATSIQGSTTDSEEGEELSIHDFNVVTLDNAASTHIFRNKNLLHSVRLVKKWRGQHRRPESRRRRGEM